MGHCFRGVWQWHARAEQQQFRIDNSHRVISRLLVHCDCEHQRFSSAGEPRGIVLCHRHAVAVLACCAHARRTLALMCVCSCAPLHAHRVLLSAVNMQTSLSVYTVYQLVAPVLRGLYLCCWLRSLSSVWWSVCNVCVCAGCVAGSTCALSLSAGGYLPLSSIILALMDPNSGDIVVLPSPSGGGSWP